ncbi:unnamed protein product [Caenorhabditis angaria]|uniref:Uncharacterized protein n=1 Tax=Caenorhabditis angaria TaxID=860376 RepID=A0A9P1MWG3_9PELO|nr:unnamed protein product [Caenorhabditis angaria]
MPHCQARSISREDFSNIFRGYDKVFGYSIFRLIFHKEIGILIRSIVLEYGLHLPSSVIKQCQPSFNRNPSAVVQLLEDVVEQCAENKPVDTASLLGKLISIPESETLKQLKIMRCNAGVAMDFVLKLGNSDNFTVALWLKSMKEASMSLSRHDAQMLEDSHRNYLKSLFSSSTSIKF